MNTEQMEEEFEVLKHGNAEGFPDAFADIRARLKGKIGQPILLIDAFSAPDAENFPMRLGILRDDRLLTRKEWTISKMFTLAFHTGPVARFWREWGEPPKEKEGPFMLYDSESIILIQERHALRHGLPPQRQETPHILIGQAEIGDWAANFFKHNVERFKPFAKAVDALTERASVEDTDIYGRTSERKQLLERLIAVNELYEPSFGGPDEIDHPKMRKVVGEMALCIRRAAQLEFNHELVKKFESYLKP